MRPRSRGQAHAPQFLPGKRQAGFSLLELVVVFFILSVLGAVAVPFLKRANLEARTTAVVNDLRVFAGALQAHAHDRGDWPSAAAPGELPAGLQTSIVAANWARTTPIGGRYAWAPDTLQQGERYRAAIVITSVGDNPVSDDRRQLTDIDRRLDDGNLSTGRFRLGYRDQPVLVIEH